MPKLILNGEIISDEWHVLDKEDVPSHLEIPEDKVLIPLSSWLALKDKLVDRDPSTYGVWLDSDEEPESLAADVEQLKLIAVNFPKFVDGRGYSIARLLRERFGFTGELRAIGDVLLDQLFYMKRCGFNAFALRPDRSAEAALAGLSTFTENYQTSVDEPKPLFRRRA